MVEWTHDRIADWVACSTNVGGAEVAAWEALLEMESLDPKGGKYTNSAATLVVVLAKAFEKVQLVVLWHWDMWFKFPTKSVKSSWSVRCA